MESKTASESAPSPQADQFSECSSAELPDVSEELAEMRLVEGLERQASSSSAGGNGETGGGGDIGGGGASALFADEDEEDVAAAPPASPPSAAEPQQQLAALRSAAAAAAAEVSSTAAAAAAAGGSSAAPGGEPAAPAEAALAAHPRHVFVFSTAGKPIFCYRGDESRLAGLMATAKAILSVAHSKGHTLKHVRSGPHRFVFLERPPLCLVGVSALAEPPAVMRMQLSLVHGQIVSLLTSTALQAMFARNPGYDARRLLGGSEGTLRSLIHSFTAAPAALLGAYPSLPLLGGVRQALGAALAAAVKATGAVHGVVVAGGAVAAACPCPGQAALQQWDLLLLLNLLGASPSLRHSCEAMTPICLPRFNPAANLHAYIRYVDAPTQTAIVLLCGGMPDPGALAAAAAHWQQQLEAIGALHALVQCAAREQQLAGGGGRDASSSGGEGALLAVDALPAAAGGGRFGTTPLLHFIYKLSARQQYVMSPFSAPLLEGGLQQSLIVAYSQLRAAQYEGSTLGGGALQRLRYEARPRFCLLGQVNQDTELYLVCDPLTVAAEAAALAARLGMWLHARHDQLFSLQ